MDADKSGKRRVKFRVAGRVQGVGFRYSAKGEADRLGVRGWVRNLSEPAVEGVAEGDAAAVERFLRWCQQGPPGAQVDSIRFDDEHHQSEFSGFEIRR